MATTFYEMYRCLCQKSGKSDSAIAAEIGLSNSTVTTWKQGALPRRPTIQKVADYFGVTPEYMLGSTIEAQIDATESKIRHLKAALDFSDDTDPAERIKLEADLEVLEESYNDLRLARSLTNEKAPTQEGERPISDREIMFALWGDTTDVDESDLEDVKRYAAFVRERKRKS